MSAKAIREYHGKRLVSKWLGEYSAGAHDLEDRVVQLTSESFTPQGLKAVEEANPWLLTSPLVAKPDQLIKRRGKAGLLAVNKSWAEVQEWVAARMGKEQKVNRKRSTCCFAFGQQPAV
jgi:ATP citrate (pro-S)-lyase